MGGFRRCRSNGSHRNSRPTPEPWRCSDPRPARPGNVLRSQVPHASGPPYVALTSATGRDELINHSRPAHFIAVSQRHSKAFMHVFNESSHDRPRPKHPQPHCVSHPIPGKSPAALKMSLSWQWTRRDTAGKRPLRLNATTRARRQQPETPRVADGHFSPFLSFRFA
jgi:hypothetical protein